MIKLAFVLCNTTLSATIATRVALASSATIGSSSVRALAAGTTSRPRVLLPFVPVGGFTESIRSTFIASPHGRAGFTNTKIDSFVTNRINGTTELASDPRRLVLPIVFTHECDFFPAPWTGDLAGAPTSHSAAGWSTTSGSGSSHWHTKLLGLRS